MIHIRDAGIEDLHMLRELGMATYSEHFSEIWSVDAMERFLNEDFSIDKLQASIDSPASHSWLIAFNDQEQAVGFAKLNWSRPTPLCGQPGTELQKIYFLKSQAGKGFGKQLLHFIFESARERNQSLIWLDVLKTNTSAQHFYEGFGFRALGEIPFSTDKADIGMIVMRCDLGP